MRPQDFYLSGLSDGVKEYQASAVIHALLTRCQRFGRRREYRRTDHKQGDEDCEEFHLTIISMEEL